MAETSKIKTSEKVRTFMRRSGFTEEEIARELCIDTQALIFKIKNNCFSRFEIDTLRRRLDIR